MTPSPARGEGMRSSIRRRDRTGPWHQVQRLPREGMGARDVLVQLDAESRLVGRDDVAVLPADRLLQELGLKTVPTLDALQDQEIRAARRELDVRGADDRPAIEMRRDLRVVRLGHPGDLLGLQQTAD